MGLETKCLARLGKQDALPGRLHLDSQEISFSGGGVRWKAPLSPAPALRADGDWLVIGRGQRAASFQLGPALDRWREKILHPPTRLTKLGLKPEQACWLSGTFDNQFLEELAEVPMKVVRSAAKCDVAFLCVETSKDLGKLDRAYAAAATGVCFWVIWPKGQTAITRNQVIARAGALGMGPGKICAFDAQRTAMRFMKK